MAEICSSFPVCPSLIFSFKFMFNRQNIVLTSGCELSRLLALFTSGLHIYLALNGDHLLHGAVLGLKP